MMDDPLDFTPLDPSVDPVRWEAVADAIRLRAAPELARRTETGDVLGIIGYWARPMLAAAMVVVGISLAALATFRPQAAWGGIVEALQLDEPVATWLEHEGPLTTDDVLIAIEQRTASR
jgi:hypothetical protein